MACTQRSFVSLYVYIMGEQPTNAFVYEPLSRFPEVVRLVVALTLEQCCIAGARKEALVK